MNDSKLPPIYRRESDFVSIDLKLSKDHRFKHDQVPVGLPTTAPTIGSTNPKHIIGSSKVPLHLWSPLASAYGAIGLMNGKKYGYGNYKATPVVASIYISALKRHLSAFEEGEEFDSDGVPHLSAILANVAILLDSRVVGTLVDDRNISGGYLQEIKALEAIAQKIDVIHKDTYYHYTIKDNPTK